MVFHEYTKILSKIKGSCLSCSSLIGYYCIIICNLVNLVAGHYLHRKGKLERTLKIQELKFQHYM